MKQATFNTHAGHVTGKALNDCNSWTDHTSENIPRCGRQHGIQWTWQKYAFTFEIFDENLYVCICHTDFFAIFREHPKTSYLAFLICFLCLADCRNTQKQDILNKSWIGLFWGKEVLVGKIEVEDKSTGVSGFLF